MAREVLHIAAILLAAGASRRMGATNKLLLPVDGEPMIRRSARTLLASRVASVTVVTGHQAARIEATLEGLDVRLIRNPRHAEGQMTSVRRGVLAAEVADGYLIGLGDQPAVGAADVDHLIAAFADAPPDRILVPILEGERGNPIILPASARAEVKAGGVNFGCRNLIQRHPGRIHIVEAKSAAVLGDVDTPAAYGELCVRSIARAPQGVEVHEQDRSPSGHEIS
jgi:molybdenum cofactor cytidylyltransferase